MVGLGVRSARVAVRLGARMGLRLVVAYGSVSRHAKREHHQHERDRDQDDVDPPVRFVCVWINPWRHKRKRLTTNRHEGQSLKFVFIGVH